MKHYKNTKYSKNLILNIIKKLREERAYATIKEIPTQCALCGRKEGDIYVLRPIHKLTYLTKIKVKISYHIFENVKKEIKQIPICDGCHFMYHYFNLLK